MTNSNRFKNIIFIISAAAVVTISFFLPQLILTLQDKNYYGGYEQMQVDDIGLSLISDLTPIEKLSFAAQPVSTVELEAGRYLDIDSANQIVMSFLDDISLYSGLWDFTAVYCQDELIPESASVGLNMDSQGKSMIIWDLSYTFEYGSFQIRLDDETGLILGCSGTFSDDLWLAYGETYYGESEDFFLSPVLNAYASYLYYAGELSYYEMSSVDENTICISLTDGTEVYGVMFYTDGSFFEIN